MLQIDVHLLERDTMSLIDDGAADCAKKKKSILEITAGIPENTMALETTRAKTRQQTTSHSDALEMSASQPRIISELIVGRD